MTNVVVNIMEDSINVPRRPKNRRRKLANRAAGIAPIGGELTVETTKNYISPASCGPFNAWLRAEGLLSSFV
jgi:hypothetical protein